MHLPIFYQANVTTTDAIILNEETSKHCIQVLRMVAGERLQLTNGYGNVYTCVIVSAHKKNTVVAIVNEEIVPPPTIQNTIAISLLKNTTRFEWFIEKAVELGITNIIPLLCSRTEKQQFKQERLQGIVVSAMLQSQQYWLPTLHTPISFTEAITNNATVANKFIAHCYTASQKIVFSTKAIASQNIIFIGPEGDFTTAEIAMAQPLGYVPVSLGNTRLRTETAALKAAVILSCGEI